MNSPPKWFKVIAVVALVWNLLGCFAFVSDLRLSPEDVAHLSRAQQALYNARPGWAVAGTALAVLEARWAVSACYFPRVGHCLCSSSHWSAF